MTKNKKPSKYYHDVVKMIPLALAEAQYSDEKCLLLGEACMQVLDILKEYKEKRAAFVEQLNQRIKSSSFDSSRIDRASAKDEQKWRERNVTITSPRVSGVD